MRVILLDDVSKVGRRGEVRDVSDGYARNYLIPKKLALSATAGNLKNLEQIKTQQDAKAGRVKGEAEALRERIEALVYEERRQASEEGKLFGSVTAQDIVEFLERHGIKVERRRAALPARVTRGRRIFHSHHLHAISTAYPRFRRTRRCSPQIFLDRIEGARSTSDHMRTPYGETRP